MIDMNEDRAVVVVQNLMLRLGTLVLGLILVVVVLEMILYRMALTTIQITVPLVEHGNTIVCGEENPVLAVVVVLITGMDILDITTHLDFLCDNI